MELKVSAIPRELLGKLPCFCGATVQGEGALLTLTINDGKKIEGMMAVCPTCLAMKPTYLAWQALMRADQMAVQATQLLVLSSTLSSFALEINKIEQWPNVVDLRTQAMLDAIEQGNLKFATTAQLQRAKLKA